MGHTNTPTPPAGSSSVADVCGDPELYSNGGGDLLSRAASCSFTWEPSQQGEGLPTDFDLATLSAFLSTESGSSALVPGERFVYERPRQRRRLCVASPDRPSILDVLPPETLLLILERLEWHEIVLLRAVNHRLKAIVERHSSLFRR